MLILSDKGVGSRQQCNQLLRGAKKRPSVYFCSLVYISNTFLRILATPKGHIPESVQWMCRHLWSSDVILTSVVLSPMLPSLWVSPLSLRPTYFGFLSRELDTFLLSRPLLLSPLHHTESSRHSIIWQLFSLLSIINRSNLLASISWPVRILKCHGIIIIIILLLLLSSCFSFFCSSHCQVLREATSFLGSGCAY